MWNRRPAVSTIYRPGLFTGRGFLFSGIPLIFPVREQTENIMYRDVNSLNPTDATYIAGLIDGEGTVTLSHRHRNETRHLVVSISNTERQLLDFVLKTVGAGKITRKSTSQSHHSASYTYTISNRQGLTLLEQIFPYLKSYKQRRSRLILNEYIRLTPRNGYYTADSRRARREFECKLLAIKP